MCRFYCCLAAHQRTRKKDSAEPSFPILWTPPHPPGDVRCGGALLLPRAYRDLVSLYPVLSLLASSEFCAAICVRAIIVRVSVGLLGWYRSFFIIGGKKDAVCVAFLFVFLITADREMVPISSGASPFHQLCRVQKYRKNAFVRLKL